MRPALVVGCAGCGLMPCARHTASAWGTSARPLDGWAAELQLQLLQPYGAAAELAGHLNLGLGLLQGYLITMASGGAVTSLQPLPWVATGMAGHHSLKAVHLCCTAHGQTGQRKLPSRLAPHAPGDLRPPLETLDSPCTAQSPGQHRQCAQHMAAIRSSSHHGRLL
jgi:hypothetical protein